MAYQRRGLVLLRPVRPPVRRELVPNISSFGPLVAGRDGILGRPVRHLAGVYANNIRDTILERRVLRRGVARTQVSRGGLRIRPQPAVELREPPPRTVFCWGRKRERKGVVQFWRLWGTGELFLVV